MLPTIDSGRTGDHRRFIFGDSSSSTLTRRLIQSSFAVRPSVVLLSIVPSALSFLPFFDSWFNFERNNFANFCFYCQFSDLIQFTSESQSVIFRRGPGDESVGGWWSREESINPRKCQLIQAGPGSTQPCVCLCKQRQQIEIV